MTMWPYSSQAYIAWTARALHVTVLFTAASSTPTVSAIPGTARPSAMAFTVSAAPVTTAFPHAISGNVRLTGQGMDKRANLGLSQELPIQETAFHGRITCIIPVNMQVGS